MFLLKILVLEKEIVLKKFLFLLIGFFIGKIELLIRESDRRLDVERVFFLYR